VKLSISAFKMSIEFRCFIDSPEDKERSVVIRIGAVTLPCLNTFRPFNVGARGPAFVCGLVGIIVLGWKFRHDSTFRGRNLRLCCWFVHAIHGRAGDPGSRLLRRCHTPVRDEPGELVANPADGSDSHQERAESLGPSCQELEALGPALELAPEPPAPVERPLGGIDRARLGFGVLALELDQIA
jgi:hypothetical protein